jgi:hypothetical protein
MPWVALISLDAERRVTGRALVESISLKLLKTIENAKVFNHGLRAGGADTLIDTDSAEGTQAPPNIPPPPGGFQA